MPYQKNRPRPTAYLDRSGTAWAARRPVILSTGRGGVKLTTAEARQLAADLLEAAADALAKPEAADA